MTVAVSTVLTNVKTALNDANLVHWTEAELLAWGSEAQTELAKITPDAAVKSTTVQLVAGAKQTKPTGALTILDVRVGGVPATPCDRAALDRFSSGWVSSPTGTTVKHWMDDPDPTIFYVYPAQSASPASAVVTHTYVPDALTAQGNLGVRDIYAAKVEDYILYRAFAKDTEATSAERAVAFRQAFYG